MKGLRLFAALVVFALLSFGARVAWAGLLSPGALSKGHSHLEGDTHCNDCHSSGKRVDQGACLKCHTDLATRINAGQGLHGRQYRGQGCEGCHVEHLGGTPIKWPSGSASALDHAQTGWPLNGAHKPLTCNKCHTKTMPRGTTTYLGVSTACSSCHKDPHENRFGANCTDCHNETSFADVQLKSFNHDLAHFQLRGAHTTVVCAKCHNTPPKYVGLKFGACTDCHTDPHAGKLGTTCTDCHEDTKWKPVTFRGANAKHPVVSLANGHAPVACARCHDKGTLNAPSKGSQCVSCHRAVHKAPLGMGCGGCHGTIQWFGLPRQVGILAHTKTTFPLTGKHDAVNCTSCHKPNLPADARYRKLASARCADCHEDKHAGEFLAQDRGECKPCHVTSGFRPTLFGVDAHANTRFALSGKHIAAPCSQCHAPKRPQLDLHVAKQACADCHQNPHGTQFATEMASGGCAHCHEAAGWNIPKINHSTWPLTGAHSAASCESCHHPTDADRKAGQGPSYKGVARNCSACHADQHLGQFRLTSPVLECDKCHATSSFKIPTFNHATMTAWPLTGSHANQDCAKCHAQVTVGQATTIRYRTPSHECSYCHANPHERRAPNPVRAGPGAANAAPADASAKKSFTQAVPCSACHSTTAWRSRDAVGGAPGFDHATTGFPLTGQHSKTACVGCHNTASVKRACVSCHEDTHRGRLSQACDTCHSAVGWKSTQPIEIHRMKRFALTGMHVLADCTQCHLRASENRFTDAPVECVACHQQDYQRPGIFPHVATATTAALPRDCSMCHRAISWVPATMNLTGSGSTPLRIDTAPPNHDMRFPVTGSHRGATCEDCHASSAAPRAVRCVGCHAHEPTRVMQQHQRPTPTDGAACLSCHPGGVRR